MFAFIELFQNVFVILLLEWGSLVRCAVSKEWNAVIGTSMNVCRHNHTPILCVCLCM